MNIWDLLIPKTMENQKRQARERFAAGLAQPEIFKTEDFPLAELAKSYKKGYGMPYPTRQPTEPAPVSPTAPEHTQNLATNLPIELISPRSLEESTMRTAGIQGRGGAEKDISSLQYYGQQFPRLEGFFEDVGEDVGDYDIPASVGGFQRPQPTEPGKSYGDPYFDTQVKALLQKETGTGEVSKIAGVPGEGGGGADALEAIYDDALNTYKAIVAKAKLDPTTALMLQMMPDIAKGKPLIDAYVTPKLMPDERAQLEQAIQIMDYIQKQRRGGFKLGKIPMEKDQEEAATAGQWGADWIKKKHGLTTGGGTGQ